MAKTFEESIQALDKIIAKLNEGDIPLDDAVAAYKEGMEHILFCRKALDDAQASLKMITEDGVLTSLPGDDDNNG